MPSKADLIHAEEAIKELFTVRDILRWSTTCFNAADLFYGHGTDNGWDEAVHLVLHALHLPHAINSAVLDARLTLRERKSIVALIKRRIVTRMPVAYLIREAWFAGLNFYVDERVLIPRSPIGELIEKHFSPWLSAEPKTILDMCTGSGCIAIACAHYFPEAQITAIDISQDALDVSHINAENHGVIDRVKIIKSNLFKAIPKQTFDLIVCNPPYVDSHDMKYLPAEFKHEPTLALKAGREGLDFAIALLRSAADHLTEDGIFILEVGNSETALAQRFPHIPFMWLEFERGGGGVLLLTAAELRQYQNDFK